MAIVDYASLQTEIGSWLHRTDLTAEIPLFIQFAETKLSSDLDARSMDARVNLTLTASNAYVNTPTDLVESRRLILTSTDPYVVLTYVTPDQLTTKFSSASLTGAPVEFTVIGAQFQFGPTPDTNYTAELIYKQRIPALSATNTTNWLLTAWPNAYLWAALHQAAIYLRDDIKIDQYQALYREVVDNLNAVDWYSGSTMRVKAA